MVIIVGIYISPPPKSVMVRIGMVLFDLVRLC